MPGPIIIILLLLFLFLGSAADCSVSARFTTAAALVHSRRALSVHVSSPRRRTRVPRPVRKPFGNRISGNRTTGPVPHSCQHFFRRVRRFPFLSGLLFSRITNVPLPTGYKVSATRFSHRHSYDIHTSLQPPFRPFAMQYDDASPHRGSAESQCETSFLDPTRKRRHHFPSLNYGTNVVSPMMKTEPDERILQHPPKRYLSG